jgi:photosystem II stability/assembly factor-like uncharacterized protein
MVGAAIGALLAVNAVLVGATLRSPDPGRPAMPSDGLVSVQASEPAPQTPGPAVDLAHGVLLRAGAGRCGGGSAPLHRSDDAGRTWQRIQTPASTILRVKVVDKTWTWIVGTDRLCRPRLYLSSDRGRSWRSRASMLGVWYRLPGDASRLHTAGGRAGSPCPTGGRVLDVAGLTQAAAAVVCANGSAYHTVNGAMSWRRIPASTEVRALDFPTPGTAFAAAVAVGCAGLRVDASLNSGRTWRSGGCVPVGVDQPVSVSFADAHQGVLATPTATFLTSDGGLRWRPLGAPEATG